jgi:leader peptidase (prepilin peptidase)/N-methyltransferase
MVIIWIVVIGLMIGSFLNVCIARIPAGESIISPGSRCPSCRAPIAWYDNIPVISYLVLGGRCRACQARISARYPIVELVTAVAFVLVGLVFWPNVWMVAQRLVFTALLIALFGTDLDVQRLPDVLTLPGLVAGLLFSLVTGPGIVSALVGAALGAALPAFVRWIWKRATGVDGMGLGDVKMLAMIGAFLGWQQVWVVLFLASASGAIIGLSLVAARRRSLQTRLPFGTFLAIAAYIAALVGDSLLSWYLHFFPMGSP